MKQEGREGAGIMANDKSVRLFIALTADGLGDLLWPVYGRLAEYPRAVKPVAPANYHITLKFLGETAPETFRALRDEFSTLRPGVAALPATLRGLGAFPGLRKPQVLWCGLDCDRDAVQGLQAMMEDLSERHGFRRDVRRFTPHLTLARLRREAGMPPDLADYFAAHRDALFGESRFDRVVLFRSDLGREGPTYTAMEEIVLT